jgi:hypothetical protein
MKTDHFNMPPELTVLIFVLAAVLAWTAAADGANAGLALPTSGQSPTATSQGDATIAEKQAAEAEGDALQAKLLERFKNPEPITNTLGMVMVWLPAGYRASQYEVTQAQYETIMGENPSAFKEPELAVNNVTLSEARQFCMDLTTKERDARKLPVGYRYSLPSEEQWEYYVADADLRQSVTAYYGDRYHPEKPGLFPPNRLGLYNTRGGVWDLCDNGVARGGSWYSYDDYVYLWFRFVTSPNQRYNDLGFRVVLQPDAAADP